MDANELYDPEFRKLINIYKKGYSRTKKQTVIIPVGSLEQHGAHLPITTDSDIVTEIASRLGKKCGFIVFPAVSYGVSFEHEPLFNTSISPKKFADFLLDIIHSLISNHIISIIILNGHHGNTRFIEQLENSFLRPQTPGMKETRAFQQARMSAFKLGLKVRSYSYWRYMKHEFDHAGFVETSLMLAISDKVRMKKAKKGLIMENLSKLEQSAAKKLSTERAGFPKVAPNGVWGDPTNATKKDGEKFLAEIVRNLAKECQT
jgi:creatinine amidohydrolase